MKKIITSGLLVLLISNQFIGFGEVIPTKVALKMDAFIEKAIENDLDLVLLNDEITVAESELKQIEKDNLILKKEHTNADEYVGIFVKLEYNPQAKKVQIDQLKRKKEILTADITLKAKNKYIGQQMLYDDVTFQKLALEKVSKDYLIKEKEFNLGKITANDLVEFKLLEKQQELAYQKSEQDYQLYAMETNQFLGLESYAEINLMTSVKLYVKYDYNLDQVDVLTFENVIAAKEAMDLAELKYQVYMNHMYNSVPLLEDKVRYYGAPTDLSEVKKARTSTQVEYQKTIRSEKIKLRISYNTLQNTKYDVEISNLKYQKALSAQESDLVKLKLGMITQSIYDNTFDEMRNAYNISQKTLEDSYIQYLTFDNLVN